SFTLLSVVDKVRTVQEENRRARDAAANLRRQAEALIKEAEKVEKQAACRLSNSLNMIEFEIQQSEIDDNLLHNRLANMTTPPPSNTFAPIVAPKVPAPKKGEIVSEYISETIDYGNGIQVTTQKDIQHSGRSKKSGRKSKKSKRPRRRN
ncbi:hypothetical protein PFISCL1PPCAC_11875, partial [Pristionchus fissidentatus]